MIPDRDHSSLNLDIHDVARIIELPLDEWANDHLAVAGELDLILNGVTSKRWGHYLGPFIPGTKTELWGRPFILHRWLELPDGTIIDPVRWTFEGVEPRIAVIRSEDPEHDEYDDIGHRWRQGKIDDPPTSEMGDEEVCLTVPKGTGAALFVLLGLGQPQFRLAGPLVTVAITKRQAHWLLDLPEDALTGQERYLVRAALDGEDPFQVESTERRTDNISDLSREAERRADTGSLERVRHTDERVRHTELQTYKLTALLSNADVASWNPAELSAKRRAMVELHNAWLAAEAERTILGESS